MPRMKTIPVALVYLACSFSDVDYADSLRGFEDLDVLRAISFAPRTHAILKFHSVCSIQVWHAQKMQANFHTIQERKPNLIESK